MDRTPSVFVASAISSLIFVKDSTHEKVKLFVVKFVQEQLAAWEAPTNLFHVTLTECKSERRGT